MSKNKCPGCARNEPIHNGIHMAEFSMTICTAHRYLELEPKTRDVWHQKPKRERDVPFTCDGGER